MVATPEVLGCLRQRLSISRPWMARRRSALENFVRMQFHHFIVEGQANGFIGKVVIENPRNVALERANRAVWTRQRCRHAGVSSGRIAYEYPHAIVCGTRAELRWDERIETICIIVPLFVRCVVERMKHDLYAFVAIRIVHFRKTGVITDQKSALETFE